MSVAGCTVSRIMRSDWEGTMSDRDPSGSSSPVRVHNFGYTTGVDDSQSQLSVRDARAHFAELITRAQGGTPTIITRNGQAVTAVVPIEDFNALEDAIDRYFAREA